MCMPLKLARSIIQRGAGATAIMVLPEIIRWVSSSLPFFALENIVNFIISTIFTLLSGLYLTRIYFHPHTLHPQIGSAILVNFDLPSHPAAGAGTNPLQYDLAINITFINKSSLTSVHFDHFITGLYYNGTKIGPSDYSAPTFKLKQEGSRMVSLVLRGQANNVSVAVAEAFARERAEGQFNFNVKVKNMLTYRFFPHRMTYYYEFDCWLQFPPVPGNGMPAVTGGFGCDLAK